MEVLSKATEMTRVVGKSVSERIQHDQYLTGLQLRFHRMKEKRLKQWRESVVNLGF